MHVCAFDDFYLIDELVMRLKFDLYSRKYLLGRVKIFACDSTNCDGSPGAQLGGVKHGSIR